MKHRIFKNPSHVLILYPMSFELLKLQKFTKYLLEKDHELADRVHPLNINQDGELYSTAGESYYSDRDWEKIVEY